MKTNPVSFGSLMVFTIDDGKPKIPIPVSMKISFQKNPDLMGYNITDTVELNEKDRDGTVHNAFKNYCRFLDEHYKERLKNEPQTVIMTETDFFVNPRTKEKRYFLTAATNKDETHILNVLNNGTDFYVAKFNK